MISTDYWTVATQASLHSLEFVVIVCNYKRVAKRWQLMWYMRKENDKLDRYWAVCRALANYSSMARLTVADACKCYCSLCAATQTIPPCACVTDQSWQTWPSNNLPVFSLARSHSDECEEKPTRKWLIVVTITSNDYVVVVHQKRMDLIISEKSCFTTRFAKIRCNSTRIRYGVVLVSW